MDVKILYFATLRDRAGVKEEQIQLPEGTTVADLKAVLTELHPDLTQGMPSAVIAVNREFAFPEEELSHGDEVGIFPPVSGGNGKTICELTEGALDLDVILKSLVTPNTGAACFFTGVVRGITTRDEAHETDYLEYEAYQPMALAKLEQVANEMRSKWASIEGIAIIQRIGHLDSGSPTVLVACTAAHRDSGVFEAARYGIDRLKEIVPIWKKEVGPGGEYWVEGEYLPDKKDRNA